MGNSSTRHAAIRTLIIAPVFADALESAHHITSGLWGGLYMAIAALDSPSMRHNCGGSIALLRPRYACTKSKKAGFPASLGYHLP